jgi:hypothetical protein
LTSTNRYSQWFQMWYKKEKQTQIWNKWHKMKYDTWRPKLSGTFSQILQKNYFLFFSNWPRHALTTISCIYILKMFVTEIKGGCKNDNNDNV